MKAQNRQNPAFVLLLVLAAGGLAMQLHGQNPSSAPSSFVSRSSSGNRAEGEKERRREIIDSIEKWREIDRQLLESARKFNEISRRKHKLDERLEAARSGFEPERFRPSDVINKRATADTMTELEAVASDLRKQRERIGRIVWSVSASRKELIGLLDARRAAIESKAQDARSAEERTELERVLAWRRSLEIGPEEALPEFYAALLGNEIMPGLLESIREGWRGRFGRPRDGNSRSDQPGLSPDMNVFDPRRDNTPEAMAEHIRRLERAQRAQQAVIRRQRQEITDLKERLAQYESVGDVEPGEDTPAVSGPASDNSSKAKGG